MPHTLPMMQAAGPVLDNSQPIIGCERPFDAEGMPYGKSFVPTIGSLLMNKSYSIQHPAIPVDKMSYGAVGKTSTSVPVTSVQNSYSFPPLLNMPAMSTASKPLFPNPVSIVGCSHSVARGGNPSRFTDCSSNRAIASTSCTSSSVRYKIIPRIHGIL